VKSSGLDVASHSRISVNSNPYVFNKCHHYYEKELVYNTYCVCVVLYSQYSCCSLSGPSFDQNTRGVRVDRRV
ncbi:hypothetical protein HAX54_013034, partial [Datura stramonium]|nr:hypothetical protein [Datura stramonium]